MKRISGPSPNSPIPIHPPDGRIWPRVALVVALIAVAAGAFTYGIWSILSGDLGWQQVEAVSPQTIAASELTLYYSVTTREEQRALPVLYTQTADRAYKIFSGEPFDGIHGLGYLNSHPGEPVAVEPELYRALEMLEDFGSRYLYYAPVYERYRGIYSCREDSETEFFDPALSQEIDSYLKEVRLFAGDPSAVQVVLLGENQVKLTVSQAYQEFARKNDIESFLDFFWLRNAFAVDMVADALAEAGYVGGILSSFEGFARVLGEGRYTLELTTCLNGAIAQAAAMECTGPKSIASFRAFPVSAADQAHYYVRSDGVVRTPYIGQTDSLCHGAVSSLTAFSQERGCAALAVALLPIYTADALEETALEALADVSAVWADGGEVFSIGPGISIQKP